jgi:hypothetical protein
MKGGVTSIKVKESLEKLARRLRQAKTASAKERLQVLYWLKQESALSISAIAKAPGKHETPCKIGCQCTEMVAWKGC